MFLLLILLLPGHVVEGQGPKPFLASEEAKLTALEKESCEVAYRLTDTLKTLTTSQSKTIEGRHSGSNRTVIRFHQEGYW